MKKLGLVLLALLLLLSSVALVGCSGGDEDDDGSGSIYSAEDILYVSEKGAKLVTVKSRDYMKVNNGIAAVGLLCSDNYTGPILVGLTADAVAYQYSYGGTQTVTEHATVTVDGKTYYYSLDEGFMGGNYVNHIEKLDIYCCLADNSEDAAKEIIALLDQTKFAAKKISTAAELAAIAGSGDAFELAHDIDLSDVENWAPIEDFTGSLSGAGHKITGLTVSSTNTESIGLFGVLNGMVSNLTVVGTVSSRGDAGKAGILAGTNRGRIEHVIVEGEVSAQYYSHVGGLVGYNDCGEIHSCENRATVLGKENVGGIAGTLMVDGNDSAKKNVNTGEVTGATNVGGVFGMLTSAVVKTSSDFTYSISEQTNKNSVYGKENVGGVVGNVSPAEKYSSYNNGVGYFTISVFVNSGEVKATGDCVGGIIGFAKRLTEITVSENKANVEGGHYVGGYVGKAPDTAIKIASNTSVITGKGYVGGIAGYAGKIDTATNSGDVVSTAIIVEGGKSRSYVGGIAGYCTGLNNAKNTVDIEVANAGSYVGGLVGYLQVGGNDLINGNENIGSVTGADSVGGIAGYATMFLVKTGSDFTYTFLDNSNSGTMTGTTCVGGLFGSLVGADEYSSYNNGLGYFSVSECDNDGEVTATGDYAGGIIGFAIRLRTLTVCANSADVTGGHFVGGYVGDGAGANIKLAINNNTITGKGYVGGIAGRGGIFESCTNNGTLISTAMIVEGGTGMAYVGGIAGYCKGALSCVNNSDIAVSTGGQYVGGIAGFVWFEKNNELNDNENYGTIGGADYTGGIAGYIRFSVEKNNNNYSRAVSGNKNNSAVSGDSYVGGIFGYVLGPDRYSSYYDGYGYVEVTYCENTAEVSGSSYVGGIVGGHTRLKTDSNLMDTNTTLFGEKLGQ